MFRPVETLLPPLHLSTSTCYTDKPQGLFDHVAHKQVGIPQWTTVHLLHLEGVLLPFSLVLQCAYPQKLEGFFHLLADEVEAVQGKAQMLINLPRTLANVYTNHATCTKFLYSIQEYC